MSCLMFQMYFFTIIFADDSSLTNVNSLIGDVSDGVPACAIWFRLNKPSLNVKSQSLIFWWQNRI